MLKRFVADFTIVENTPIGVGFFRLILQHQSKLPQINAGQFVEIQIPDTAHTFLRRPISIHDVNYNNNTISLLVKNVGNGTNLLSKLSINDTINIVYPLGNGFTIDDNYRKVLLVGGGVGIAPLLYLGKVLKSKGVEVEILLGARDAEGLLCLSDFGQIGKINITTEDGSVGTKGFVTNHEIMLRLGDTFDAVMVCGPTPMMKAVGQVCLDANVTCEVSLENKMACGIGVCLCCVTKTKEGHKCVCSEGPVFNIKQLEW
ncbi:MAG: dihydroorotate dehydrogenase electron transfer subunit [Marinilabiliaceae bacterium]|nr:dihydroorotate dehydrogenase electron transfer subunit [Marinilabiliaceae bacterium]